LGVRHPYHGDILKLIKPAADVKPQSLAQYVAASAIVHSFDGWSYLARAFESAIAGDPRTALHLAYYAELRAGMSLLAGQGMGIFNDTHFAIKTFRTASSLTGPRTHPVVGKLLKEWTQKSGAARHLLQNIFISGRSIEEWLGELGASEPTQSEAAGRWLEAWSIDIELIEQDREARNDVSYRPSNLQWPEGPALHPRNDCLDTLLAFWESLKPVGAGSADLIDRTMLRESVRLAYEFAGGKPLDAPKYATFVHRLDSTAPQTLIDFLVEPLNMATPFLPFEKARERVPSLVPMLSRAMLLLRLSSSGASGLMRQAGVKFSDVTFWWSKIVTEFGFSDEALDADEINDLWNDVDTSIDEILEWLDVSPTPSSREVIEHLGAQPAISQFQRGALWLLGHS